MTEKLQIAKSELTEERARNDAAAKKLDRDYKKKIKELQKQYEEKEMGLLAREVAANKEWTQEVETLEAALARAQQEARQVCCFFFHPFALGTILVTNCCDPEIRCEEPYRQETS